MEDLERRRLLSAAAEGTGLLGEYFNTTRLKELAITRTDRTVAYNWQGGAPAQGLKIDGYSVRWTGQLDIAEAGQYQFRTTSEGGVRLYIDGHLIIDAWSDHTMRRDNGQATLAEGKHDIDVLFRDGRGDPYIKLEWARPGQSMRVVPQSVLTPAADLPTQTPDLPEDAVDAPAPSEPIQATGDGLTGAYFRSSDFTQQAMERTDATIDFRWGGAGPASGFSSERFSVRWTGQIEIPTTEKYAFTTISDDGVRLWIDGNLVIDHWDIHAPVADHGTIDLTAGKHDIKMEYYENTGASVAQLAWATASRTLEIIPQQYLYTDDPAEKPAPAPVPTPAPSPVPVPPSNNNGKPIPVGAVTITVGPNESIRSIQQAVNMARPGDVILVKNGTYREGITIKASGTADKRIAIVAETVGGAVIDAGGRAFGLIGDWTRYITVKGLKVINANSGTQGMNAAFRAGSHWQVEDVTVDRAAGAGIGIIGDDCTFIRTYANNCGQIGWGGLGDRSMLKDCGAIGNNTKRYNAAWEAGGVKFYITDGVVVDGGVWANNEGPAIWFDYQNKNFLVKNTEVYGNRGAGQNWAGVGIASEISAGPGTFINNNIHDNSGDGIALWEAYGVTILNNTLTNDGISFRDLTTRAPYRVHDVLIQGNRVVNGGLNSQVPRHLFSSKNIVVTGNSGI